MSFPPHAPQDYALLADGERGALIGPQGDIVWLCSPGWHDNPVFAALIGGRGGYAVTPHSRHVPGGHYEDGTLIWRSHWDTAEGVTECREALALPAEPGRLVLLRQLRAEEGPTHVRVVLDPYADHGRGIATTAHRADDGVWYLNAGKHRLRWQGVPAAGFHGQSLIADLVLKPGERHDLVLECSSSPLPRTGPKAEQVWSATEEAWRRAVPGLDRTIAGKDARHAYAVLRGLTHHGGGMVAAATTGLPEPVRARPPRDQRYVWIRDLGYAGQAAAAAETPELLDAAVRFVTERLLTDGPHLAPAYTVHGTPVPDRRDLELSGYPGGSGPAADRVRKQFQLDSFGEALLLLAAAERWQRLDTAGWPAVELAVGAIAERRSEPDTGLDAGGREQAPRLWTHSRLTCVAGLRAVAAVATGLPLADTCERLADALLADVSATCVHPYGHWQRTPDDPGADAALLLAAVRGALPADDPRTRATLACCRVRLADDYFMRRFRDDDRPLEDAEGASLLCGFAMALAEHQQGRRADAYRWFERNRAACGAPGLYAEVFDTARRQPRGNLPRALVHALLLESAARLA
ncbi:glycoside hydrolase family 15 protein [Streptomyces sp. NPDC047022]|uniref:glycoside hydrolase family 15 protein n=1 Tax=Streptomyces sp. NPDC047022 TaxID=3155737 RepID=UPI0033D4D472